MPGSAQWRTQAGSLTSDNRDAYALIERPHSSLYVVADGSSSHPHSGDLAKALVSRLIANFECLQPYRCDPKHTASLLLQIINACHTELSRIFPRAACSYLALYLSAGTAFSIHEGDCCLGLLGHSGTVRWLSKPHCAANWQNNLTHAEIARHSSRHRLTRCFSARRVCDPQVSHWPAVEHGQWLLASDGFWAGLGIEEQEIFLCEGKLKKPQTPDDISCLSVATMTNC